MKFGQNLPRNQIPEWASHYIDYKSLKKLIKTEAKAVEAGDEPDLAGRFTAMLAPLLVSLTFL
jgi:glycerophosphodiester phosphodiesterase